MSSPACRTRSFGRRVGIGFVGKEGTVAEIDVHLPQGRQVRAGGLSHQEAFRLRQVSDAAHGFDVNLHAVIPQVFAGAETLIRHVPRDAGSG